MSVDMGLIYDVKRKMLAKYPRFGSEIAVANIEFRDDLPFHTASTDGKNIYVDPNYFESLSENDKLFIIAHEIMHIKFMHMYRLMDKDGNMRNLELWNIATDAIINANLERDGFTIKEGYVNMPEAIQYSAEELYQKLLQEKEKKQQEQEQSSNGQNQEQGDGQEQEEQQGSNDNGQGQGEGQEQENQQDSENNEHREGQEQENQQDSGNNEHREGQERENQQGSDNNEQSQEQEQDNKQENGKCTDNKDTDRNKSQTSDEGISLSGDHSLWEEAFKEQQNAKKKGQKQGKTSKQQKQKQTQKQVQKVGQEQEDDEQTDMGFDEKGEFEDNRKQKREKFMSRREKTEKDLRSTKEETIKLGNIGKSKEPIDWKVLIRREVEKTETIWSQRRSIAENNYAYRLEENDIEDEAETEIMIDVSGSVNLDLVKAFLRQIKPLLKQSKLRVGCFNEKFWGFVDIKNVRDIDNFTIAKGARGQSAWTEDWDLAVRSFTKKREINKIVFTDGYPCPGTMPKEDLKRENVIWLVYGNKDFNPCCGKVINITEKQLEQLHLANKNSFVYEI